MEKAGKRGWRKCERSLALDCTKRTKGRMDPHGKKSVAKVIQWTLACYPRTDRGAAFVSSCNRDRNRNHDRTDDLSDNRCC